MTDHNRSMITLWDLSLEESFDLDPAENRGKGRRSKF